MGHSIFKADYPLMITWFNQKGYSGSLNEMIISYFRSKLGGTTLGYPNDLVALYLSQQGYSGDIGTMLNRFFCTKIGVTDPILAQRLFFSNSSNDFTSFITFIASAQKISTDFNAATTTAIDTRAANFIVVYGSSVTIGTLTDSATNTWTKLTTISNGVGSVESAIYYCANPTKSATHTFTYTLSSGAPSLSVLAFSGVATASPFDVQNGAIFNTVTSIATGSVTPSLNNEVVVTGLGAGATAGSYTADSGMTNVGYIPTVGGQGYGTGIAYKIQTTAAAINPTWSGPSGSGTVAIASFKNG